MDYSVSSLSSLPMELYMQKVRRSKTFIYSMVELNKGENNEKDKISH